jgi:ribose transport system permease protein
MKKFVGIFCFLVLVYAVLMAAQVYVLVQQQRKAGASEINWTRVRTAVVNNNYNLVERVGLSGIICLGVALLIISGGIDLSIGSVVGLSATLLAMLLRRDDFGWQPAAAIPAVLLMGALIGLLNGLLVTKVKVQAFVVTLCGLFVYRGASRWLAGDTVKGLGVDHDPLREMLYLNDLGGVPRSLLYLLVLSALAAVFLHLSVYGRYLYAIGSNERAARYSGIATDRYKLLAYVICSTLAALYGVLYLMKHNSAQPTSTGNFLELYAIAGAVLGGCSLRGGEGNVLGVLIGTAILILLPTLTSMLGIPAELEYTVIGGALLLGAILDEVLRRFGAARR